MRRMVVSKKIVIAIALAFISYTASYSQTTDVKKNVWQATGIVVKSYSNAEGKIREMGRYCFIIYHKEKKLSIKITPLEAFNEIYCRANKGWKIISESGGKELSLVKDFPQSNQEEIIKELEILVERKIPIGKYMIIYSIDNLKCN